MGEGNTQDGASGAANIKDDKNIVRPAAVIHVIFTVMENALNQRLTIFPGELSHGPLYK